MKVCVEYDDGNYWLRATSSGPIEISDGEWECYQAFEKLGKYWHDRCRGIANEQWGKENAPPIEASIFPFTDELESGVALTRAINEVIAEDTRDRHQKLLFECYLSGQISEALWAKHLAEDPTFAAYVKMTEVRYQLRYR